MESHYDVDAMHQASLVINTEDYCQATALKVLFSASLIALDSDIIPQARAKDSGEDQCGVQG